MQYEQFKEQFTEELKSSFEEEGKCVDALSCQYDTVNKKIDGVVFRIDNSNLAPTIHMNTMYDRWKEGDMSIRDMAENVSKAVKEEFEKIQEINFSAEKLTSEYIKEHSYLSIVNTEMNADLLKNVPHEEIKGTDLSAYVKVEVGENATITITNEHASVLQMTKSEILNMARENTLEQNFSVRSMESVLKDIMPAEIVEEMNLFPAGEHPNMLVISNESGYEGANAILSEETLDKACKELGTSDITIIPSSRHELLAVNTEELGLSVEDLKDIVKEINGTEVALEDQLSNNVYRYDGETRELEIGESQTIEEPSVDFGISDYEMQIGE